MTVISLTAWENCALKKHFRSRKEKVCLIIMGHYERKLNTKAGEVNLKVAVDKRQADFKLSEEKQAA